MNQEAYNDITIVISIASLLVTSGGLYAVYVQLRKVRENVWSNMHSKLCDQSFELIRLLSDTPGCYDYFYNNKKIDENVHNKAAILLAAEAIANFLEHLILQKGNLPVAQWEVWSRFIYSTLKGSAVVVEFIKSRPDWYSAELLLIVEECSYYHKHVEV